MARLRTCFFRMGAVMAGSLAALIIAEVGLRAFGVRIGKRTLSLQEPPQEDRLRSPGSPDSIRIAFLGDSFTYGLLVKDEETFARRAADLLERKYPGRYAVINMGLRGADLLSEWAIYNREKDRFRPHVLVQVISPNDMDVDLYKNCGAFFDLWGGRSVVSHYLKSIDLIETTVCEWLADRRLNEYLHGGATAEERRRSWRIIVHEIKATQQLAGEGGAVYAMVRFPWFEWLEREPYPLRDVHEEFAALAERLRFPYLDLLDVYRDKDPNTIETVFDHPGPGAHAIAAEAIVEFLEKSVLPKIRRGPLETRNEVRTREQILTAEAQHYRNVLKIEPTCRSAQVLLDPFLKAVGEP